jgi:hypothetical protein
MQDNATEGDCFGITNITTRTLRLPDAPTQWNSSKLEDTILLRSFPTESYYVAFMALTAVTMYITPCSLVYRY